MDWIFALSWVIGFLAGLIVGIQRERHRVYRFLLNAEMAFRGQQALSASKEWAPRAETIEAFRKTYEEQNR